jgi:hypothetical protein
MARSDLVNDQRRVEPLQQAAHDSVMSDTRRLYRNALKTRYSINPSSFPVSVHACPTSAFGEKVNSGFYWNAAQTFLFRNIELVVLKFLKEMLLESHPLSVNVERDFNLDHSPSRLNMCQRRLSVD